MAKETRSMTALAYDLIKEKVQNCDLMPGVPLNEKELCDRIGCGRTPVHEAVLALRNEGLIEVFPRKGLRVSAFTPEQISEIYQIRKLLEPSVCVKYFSRFDKARLLELDRCFAAVDRADDRVYYRMDVSFHRELIAAADNETLSAFFGRLMQVQYRFGIYSARVGTAIKSDYYTEHHEILEALLAEDPVRIEHALVAHANYSEVIALKTLEAVAREKNNAGN